MKEEVLFTEQQRFNQWGLRVLLGLICIAPLYGIYYQVILGKQFGNKPVGDHILYIQAVLLLLLAFFFLNITKLETRITKVGIDVRFFPFHLKTRHYSWEEIDKAIVRTYSPIGEYGGWGLKTGSGGDTYNVSGEQGIQLVFKSGRKLLIGTNKPQEAANVLAIVKQEV